MPRDSTSQLGNPRCSFSRKKKSRPFVVLANDGVLMCLSVSLYLFVHRVHPFRSRFRDSLQPRAIITRALVRFLLTAHAAAIRSLFTHAAGGGWRRSLRRIYAVAAFQVIRGQMRRGGDAWNGVPARGGTGVAALASKKAFKSTIDQSASSFGRTMTRSVRIAERHR